MAYYFFKVTPFMILDDPDVGSLETWVRDLYWKVYAATSESGGNDGLLPPLPKLAYRVRAKDMKSLMAALDAMRNVGLAEESAGGWRLTKFPEEQAARSASERGKDYRQREADGRTKHERKPNEPFDKLEEESESEKESSTAGESSGTKRDEGLTPNVMTHYSENIGELTPIIADALTQDEQAYGSVWVCAAINEAVRSEARNLKYVEAILKRWKVDGFGAKKRPEQPRKWPAKQSATSIILEYMQEQQSNGN